MGLVAENKGGFEVKEEKRNSLLIEREWKKYAYFKET